jgi:putative endonuclease
MIDQRKDLGKTGERKAVEYLESSGFRIIEKNFRLQSGEADIIAEQDDVVYFIEVKTRRRGEFLEGYSKKQKKRLWKLAEAYISRKGISKQVGFAVLGITGYPDDANCQIELVFDNFEP